MYVLLTRDAEGEPKGELLIQICIPVFLCYLLVDVKEYNVSVC